MTELDTPNLLKPLEEILRGKHKILSIEKVEDPRMTFVEVRTATETVDLFQEQNEDGHWIGYFNVTAPLEKGRIMRPFSLKPISTNK